jgi:hypothetical protein
VVQLLKSGKPSLANALNEMIQQVWISETLPKSWTERVLCPVYKKGDKLDCKNYRGICLLNIVYKAWVKNSKGTETERNGINCIFTETERNEMENI